MSRSAIQNGQIRKTCLFVLRYCILSFQKLSKAEKKQQRKQGKNDRRKAEIDTGRNTEEDSLAPSHVAQIDRVTDRMRLVHVWSSVECCDIWLGTESLPFFRNYFLRIVYLSLWLCGGFHIFAFTATFYDWRDSEWRSPPIEARAPQKICPCFYFSQPDFRACESAKAEVTVYLCAYWLRGNAWQVLLFLCPRIFFQKAFWPSDNFAMDSRPSVSCRTLPLCCGPIGSRATSQVKEHLL